MANNPLTELAQPGDDLRPFVNAIIAALRGNFFVRGDDGNLVPSGDANNALRRDIGAPTHPVETVYVNALQIAGVNVSTLALSDTAAIMFFDAVGVSTFNWPDDGRTNAIIDMQGGSGAAPSRAAGVGGADTRRARIQNINAGDLVRVQVGGSGTDDASKSSVQVGAQPIIETSAGTSQGSRTFTASRCSNQQRGTGDNAGTETVFTNATVRLTNTADVLGNNLTGYVSIIRA